MEYQVYITTNLINGKRYLGKHNGKDPKYLGSGKIIKRSIEKYGRENFKREIIHICETEKEAYELERILSEEYNVVKDDNWYNISYGGRGFLSGEKHCQFGTYLSDETKKRISNAVRGEKNGFYNKHHSEESILKISESHLGKHLSTEHKSKISKASEGIPKPRTKEHQKKITEARSKVYRITTPDGQKIVIRNLRKYCRDNNLARSSMCSRVKSKGYLCEKLDLKEIPDESC